MKVKFYAAKNGKWTITRGEDVFDIFCGVVRQDKDGVRVLTFILFGAQLAFGWSRT